MECQLCGHEMMLTSVPIKIKPKKKCREVKVLCYRCSFCHNVGLTEPQILQLPSAVSVDDFYAYSLLQKRVSMTALKKAGFIKEEKPVVENIIA